MMNVSLMYRLWKMLFNMSRPETFGMALVCVHSTTAVKTAVAGGGLVAFLLWWLIKV